VPTTSAYWIDDTSSRAAQCGVGPGPLPAILYNDLGPHERLITVRAVAVRLGLSSASVYKLCQRGELRGLWIGGALRFSPQLIDDYVTRCAVVPEAGGPD